MDIEAVFFCVSHNLVYLLYLCLSLDIRKINEQRCGLARKGHGIIIETCIIIVTRIWAKIKSCMIALAA